MSLRKVKSIEPSKLTMEGAGVRLHRAFGRVDPDLDPFLLFDDFSSDNTEDFIPGFPMHPHRGIETITYLLDGRVKHGDSLGNSGVIGPGEIQWMTAGSGIIHEEMPEKVEKLTGFQLWANLPKSHKMMEPRYRDIKSTDIAELEYSKDVKVLVVAGEISGVKGPVQDIITDPLYIDVNMQPEAVFEFATQPEHNLFIYIIEGEGNFPGKKEPVGEKNLVIFDRNTHFRAESGKEGLRFLLVSGKPIGESVAWRGPIVMNTDDELRHAFREFKEGTFIK